MKVIAERLGNTHKRIYEIYGHALKELEEAFSQSLNEFGPKNEAVHKEQPRNTYYIRIFITINN